MPKRKGLSGWVCRSTDLLNSILDWLNPLDYIRLSKRKRLSGWACLSEEKRIRLSEHQAPWILERSCHGKKKLLNYGTGWACLPEDLLNSILDRVNPLDYIRLSGVCKPWNLIVLRHHKEKRIRLGDHQFPWILERSCHGRQNFINYVTGAVILGSIPYPYTRMESCGCCHGRLIFCMPSQLIVLEPFSGVVIRLPPFNNSSFKYVDKVILSTDPSLESKFEVLATCRFSDVVAHLVFGEPMWTYSEKTRDYYTYNFVFYKDRILGASREGRIVSLNVINSSSSKEIKKRISIEEISSEILQRVPNNLSDSFFVETTNGELWIVWMLKAGKICNIFKIINSNGHIDLSPVLDLGGHSLFLGKYNSISVMASNYCHELCRPNTISYVGSLNLHNRGIFEVFNLDDQRLRCYTEIFAMSEVSWFVPSLKL